MPVEQVMGERKAYPSDLTDEQWAVVGPFLDAWKARHPSVSEGNKCLSAALASCGVLDRVPGTSLSLDTFQTGTSTGMRAKDVCHALGIGTEPKDTEGIRAN